MELAFLERQYLRFGSVLPRGDLLEIMRRDLEGGFVGHLDELVPSLIKEDDIYGKDRRGKDSAEPELGIAEVATSGDAKSQYQWWNAETQGNWLDGLARTAVLADDALMLKKAEDYISHRSDLQEPSGYIGIYKEELRFNGEFENGEFWAMSTLCRGLLALYEGVGKSEYLTAVERVLGLVMEKYPIGEGEPFSCTNEGENASCCGISHGLTITDSFYSLYKITGDEKYLSFAAWLYESYSKSPRVESDCQLDNVLDKEYHFHGHGVHTYEQFRALILAAYSDSPQKEICARALEAYLEKLDDYLCPSGAPIGDEWVNPKGADASTTGYEYCSLHELLHSYTLLLELSGDLKWADRAEVLFFNAGMGARHPERSSIAYLKSDNSYSMESVFQGEQAHCFCGKQTRYKYSPAHQDVAVCCVPNAGRIMPYYISAQWLRTEKGFLKALYGAGVMTVDIGGQTVTIEEASDYPYDTKISIAVSVTAAVKFELAFRIPDWCESFAVTGADFSQNGNVITAEEVWSGERRIEISFERKIITHTDRQGDIYFSYGATVLALPIDSTERVIKTHPVDGLFDTEYAPVGNYDYSATGEIFEAGGKITAVLIDNQTGKVEQRELVAMGRTVLRRVTFKVVR